VPRSATRHADIQSRCDESQQDDQRFVSYPHLTGTPGTCQVTTLPEEHPKLSEPDTGWRFTGHYPTNYTVPTRGSVWIEPGEVIPWDEPPDGNWEQVGPELEYPSQDIFPSAEAVPT
jgi:hypothetical protein